MSQAEFAALFNLARPSVGAYEEGRSEPKIDTIIAISDKFHVTIDTLLLRELSSTDLLGLDQFKRKMDLAHEMRTQQTQSLGIPLVTIDNRADFLLNYEKKDYLDTLKKLSWPYEQNKKDHLAFEVGNDSMTVSGEGIRSQDVLITENFQGKLKENDIYIIQTQAALHLGRLQSVRQNSLIIKPDNDQFSEIAVSTNDAIRYFRVIGLFTRSIPSDRSMEKRLLDLEKKLGEIHGKFSS